MINPIDRLVEWFAPAAAVRRAQARRVLAYYEAAKPSRLRAGKREAGSGNAAVAKAGAALREQARHMEQNHDLARGVLDVLVRNTIGTGIGVESQPRRRNGEIHDELALQLQKLWKDWCKRPEVTWQHSWGSAERILARSWYRDGEVFAQRILGTTPFLDHGTRAPYSLELLEADLVPYEYNALDTPRVVQGVEINGWGRPVGYYVYRNHPGELYRLTTLADLKRLPADRMLHLKLIDRIRQLRGVSIFAAVLTRMEDLKDYEESERIAAKIAASMAAYIKKGAPDLYEPDNASTPRQMNFRPGIIFDDLRPGEEVGVIDTNRPNTNLSAHRDGQLRAIAAGTNTTYSSTSKNYNGTYSAQRQELVEGWGAYQILAAEFISRITQPVYEDLVKAALTARLLTLDADADPETLDDAIYIAPQMPWIDPEKEANAWAALEDRVYASGPEIIRRRGANPRDVLDQQQRWRREKARRELDTPAAPAPTEKPAEEQVA